ncbi:spindle assembly abnormal protein 6 homolog isoform X1 [Bacillus rossius redtenbacheri]|uniref:spindle assembly abnormal protein 6 homolog isoform X1 n=1 Tax=Bacillus rossius redtenbacheri TaxID=93214 RepID=UPI002FDD5D80
MSHRKSYNTNDISSGGKPECLYSKIHRLYVKSKCKEEKQKDLRISVELVPSVNPVFGQNLTVQLTDDDDPFFLYGLALTEDDFKDLKSQQGLLVDFDRFPGELLRLLAECRHEGEPSTNRFLLVLEDPESEGPYSGQQTSLQVLETNNFKHLCHLCLHVSRGNDAEIKKLMAVKIKQLKQGSPRKMRGVCSPTMRWRRLKATAPYLENAALAPRSPDCVTAVPGSAEAAESGGKQLSRTESQLEEAVRRLEEKTRELAESQRRWAEERSDLHVGSLRELAQEREKCAGLQLEWQRRLADERARLEEQHAQASRGAEAELARLRSQNEALAERHRQAESLGKELAAQLEQLRKEARQLEQDCAGLRRRNVKLDADYHQEEKEVHALATRVAVLEQKLKDKTVLINKQNDLLCSTNQKQARLEECLADKDSIIQKKQQEAQNLSDELLKSNEILSKLHMELSCTKSKLKMRTSIALEQERLLDAKQRDLGEAGSRASQQAERLAALEAEVAELRGALETARSQLEEKTKHLRNNENVINWLNRRLNEAQASPLPPRSTALGLTASSTPLSTAPITAFMSRWPKNPHNLEKPSLTGMLSNGPGMNGIAHKEPTKNSVPKEAMKQDARKNQPPPLSAYFPK